MEHLYDKMQIFYSKNYDFLSIVHGVHTGRGFHIPSSLNNVHRYFLLLLA